MTRFVYVRVSENTHRASTDQKSGTLAQRLGLSLCAPLPCLVWLAWFPLWSRQIADTVPLTPREPGLDVGTLKSIPTSCFLFPDTPLSRIQCLSFPSFLNNDLFQKQAFYCIFVNFASLQGRRERAFREGRRKEMAPRSGNKWVCSWK